MYRIHNIFPLILILFLFNGIFARPTAGDETSASNRKPTVPPEKAVPIMIPKFEAPPNIDGRLDDDIWKTAAVFKDFIQIRPGDNIAPTKETIVYVGYDEKNLYLGFYCFDDPDKIRATVAKRDSVMGEDNVRVFLDTFNDQRRAYVLVFNPLGIQGDGIMTDGGADFSVDIVMDSKGVILQDGWSVEVKIPFKSLRFAAGKGKFWGFNVWRNIDRLNDEVSSWLPSERGISNLRQMGRITGFDEIKVERTLEIVPSVTASQAAERVADSREPHFSRLHNRGFDQDIGVSLKYQLTPNITLDAAVNPDFAEVEADAPVVRANERFPIFFPEKRPFFLEGIDYFRSPLQVVNTRNIADPDVALKLTGKVGKNTIGVLGAVDRIPGTDTKAFVGVLRLRRDIGKNSNIGLFATQYHFGARRHNHLVAVDGRLRIGERTNFNFQAAGSHSRRFFYDPDINRSVYRAGNGVAYQANLDYTGRNRGYFIGVNGRSRDYRADVGFTRRTNTHGINAGFRLGTEPKPQNTLIGVTTRHGFGYQTNEDGRLQHARYNFNAEWDFQNRFRIRTEAGIGAENVYEEEFGARRGPQQAGRFFGEPERGAIQYWASVGADKSFNKRVGISGSIGFTENELDLDFGAGRRFPRVSPAALAGSSRLDPGTGFGLRYGVGLNLQPTNPFSVSASYNRTELTRDDTGRTAFDANIFTLRSTYQFTRFTFFRARWDYETVYSNVNGQLLFGWSPNPGTAFYVGYNDTLSYKGFNSFRNRFDDGFRRDGRQLFIRLSYLFRRSV